MRKKGNSSGLPLADNGCPHFFTFFVLLSFGGQDNLLSSAAAASAVVIVVAVSFCRCQEFIWKINKNIYTRAEAETEAVVAAKAICGLFKGLGLKS